MLNSAGDHVQLDANSINTTGVASFGSNAIVRNGSLLELQYNGWTTGAVPQLQATAANVLAVRDTSGNGITLDSYSVKVSGLSGSGNAYACLDSAGNLYRSATACN